MRSALVLWEWGQREKGNCCMYVAELGMRLVEFGEEFYKMIHMDMGE